MTSVLSDAEAAINGPRAEAYGDAAQHFACVWHLWAPILDSDLPGPLKVALCLGQLKVARTLNSSQHRDNYVDAAGYGALAARIAGVDPAA